MNKQIKPRVTKILRKSKLIRNESKHKNKKTPSEEKDCKECRTNQKSNAAMKSNKDVIFSLSIYACEKVDYYMNELLGFQAWIKRKKGKSFLEIQREEIKRKKGHKRNGNWVLRMSWFLTGPPHKPIIRRRCDENWEKIVEQNKTRIRKIQFLIFHFIKERENLNGGIKKSV